VALGFAGGQRPSGVGYSGESQPHHAPNEYVAPVADETQPSSPPPTGSSRTKWIWVLIAVAVVVIVGVIVAFVV